MKRRRSSEGGGAAWDVEPEQCRLAGTTFFDAIVVTDGSKSEKKKSAHKKKQETKGCTKKTFGGKKRQSRAFIEAWNSSRFASAKDPSPQRRHVTQRRSMVHYGEGLASQRRREPRSGEGSFAAADQKVWSQPRSGEACFSVVDQKARLKNVALRSSEASFAVAN